jgi:entry exclusion lipoprotein TrbK
MKPSITLVLFAVVLISLFSVGYYTSRSKVSMPEATAQNCRYQNITRLALDDQSEIEFIAQCLRTRRPQVSEHHVLAHHLRL